MTEVFTTAWPAFIFGSAVGGLVVYLVQRKYMADALDPAIREAWAEQDATEGTTREATAEATGNVAGLQRARRLLLGSMLHPPEGEAFKHAPITFDGVRLDDADENKPTL